MGSNVFDLVVAVLLAYAAYRGFSKGIIAAAATFAALLLGLWGAVEFSDMTASYLSGVINVDEKMMGIIAFAITFIGIVIGVHFVAKTIESLAKAVALGFINKLFGAIFGALKFAFIISVVLFFVNAINAKMDLISTDFKKGSIFYEPISKIAPSVFKYLDFDELKNDVEEKKEELNIRNI